MPTLARLLLSSDALRAAGFAHGFSTREVDLSVTTPAPDYAEALARFCGEAGLSASSLRHANQVHGATVVVAADVSLEARPDADALVSYRELAVGVRVADCVPVLIGNPDTGAVAAIHAGWKGFVAGVVPRAIEALQKKDGDRHRSGRSLVAAIGPCIGPCCFEVSADVAAAIDEAAGVPVSFASGDRADKRLVDLRAAVRAHLVRAAKSAKSQGARALRVDIDDVAGCTRCDATRFFSFRRNGETGRMLAAIAPLLP